MLEDFLKSFLEPNSYLIYAALVFSYRKVDKSARIRNLFVYYLFTSLFLFAGQLVTDNNWVYNVFFFATVNFFSYFFYSVLTIAASRKIVLSLCTINILLFIINDLVLKQLLTEDNYLRSFYFFTIIIYSFLYLYEIINEANKTNILEQFEFWLICGYLVYFLGSLCIVLYYKYPTVEQRATLWIVHSFILFGSCIITCAGTIWLMKQKKMHNGA